MLLGNYQEQEEYATCSYTIISEFGNQFCFPNLSVIPLDVPTLCSLLSHNFTPQVIMRSVTYSIKVSNKWPSKVHGWTPACSKGKWGWTILLQLHPISLNHLQCLPSVLKMRKGYHGNQKKNSEIWVISPFQGIWKPLLDPPHPQVARCLCFLAGVFPREPALSDGSSSHGVFPAHLHWHWISVQSGGFSAQVTGTNMQRCCACVWPEAASAPWVGGWWCPTLQAPMRRQTGASLPEMPYFHQIFLYAISLVAFFRLPCAQFAPHRECPW